mmetsp:Transcript_40705/g.100114  ORF Transcript_40705/g.100114 Transcript_40705/m.100114 type:complete len:242 (+) Transcript_40705:867-1592(+)
MRSFRPPQFTSSQPSFCSSLRASHALYTASIVSTSASKSHVLTVAVPVHVAFQRYHASAEIVHQPGWRCVVASTLLTANEPSPTTSRASSHSSLSPAVPHATFKTPPSNCSAAACVPKRTYTISPSSTRTCTRSLRALAQPPVSSQSPLSGRVVSQLRYTASDVSTMSVSHVSNVAWPVHVARYANHTSSCTRHPPSSPPLYVLSVVAPTLLTRCAPSPSRRSADRHSSFATVVVHLMSSI